MPGGEFKAETVYVKDYHAKGEEAVRVGRVKIPAGLNFEFKPGQFCMLSMDGFTLWANPKLLRWAAYSVCSDPVEKELEFCIAFKETPGLSKHLKDNWKLGSVINVKGPFGAFVLRSQHDRILFVATGTGIAPIISMLRSLLRQNSKVPMTLFYGVRHASSLLYLEELEELARRHANFEFIPTVTSPGDHDWKGKRGRVQSHLKEHAFAEKEKTDIFICGNPEMVKDVKQLLPEMGFDAKRIHTEQW